jgi:ketosteroid isomerase-like protein
MPPNSKMVKGREEIMKMLNNEVQLGEQDIKFETLELTVANDLAYETGLYNLNVKPKKGEPFNDKGKYIVIWKKDSDGQWLMEIDIWNSDLPVKKN